MPRVAFKNENKTAQTNYDYPKLKLKNGEYARILLLEDPLVEYVHTLRKPQVINGIPQTFQAERRDGSKYEDYKMDFLSRPLCLGDLGILENSGADPKNCPMCKLAKDNPEAAQAPQRRYAMHVIRYRTKSGGTTLTEPYSVETLVWSFTDRIFNTITDFREEWDDLRKHDLLLGPCQNESFQKFDISVAAKAEWLLDDTKARQNLTIETFKNNQIPDLAIACGSKKEKQWIEQDIQKILEAWSQVKGAEKEDGTSSVGLSESLDGLMDDIAAPATKAKAKAQGTESLPDPDLSSAVSSDDLLADLDTESAAPEKELVTAGAPAEEAGSFDDLLADL